MKHLSIEHLINKLGRGIENCQSPEMSKMINDTIKFNEALRQENCDVVDTMLSEGYIPKPDAIKIVCKNGNLTLLQTLLSLKECDIDVQGGLDTAIMYKQTHLLDHLFVAGADVNISSEFEITLLHNVKDGKTCKWLLDMGVQQTPNRFGETPLDKACRCGYQDVVKVLLTQISGVRSISGSSRETPLSLACNDDRKIEIVVLLLSHDQAVQSLLMKNSFDHTPLYIACIYGAVNIVNVLLFYEQGAQSILIADKLGKTPLHQACINGNVDLVRILLSYKQGLENIPVSDKDGYTPLHTACLHGHKEVVELLLMYEPGVQSIFTQDKFGYTPLHVACYEGKTAVVKLLLSHRQGVQSIPVKDSQGYTALHTACYRGYAHIAKLLLSYEQGVQSILIKSFYENTCLHSACRKGSEEIVRLLLSYEQGLQCVSMKTFHKHTPMSEAEPYPAILALLQNVIVN